ncbi:hypothetical protein Tco_0909693 [Tanacetum coccineum]|uniref:Uncharacterized protein n=1 Tax=Tanacetum coccineum TaxID=301880 RepID=A0ABQ5CSW8_9ASTR
MRGIHQQTSCTEHVVAAMFDMPMTIVYWLMFAGEAATIEYRPRCSTSSGWMHARLGLGGLLLLSPIGFRMEPQLGLYVRLGEMLGLGSLTSGIREVGPSDGVDSVPSMSIIGEGYVSVMSVYWHYKCAVVTNVCRLGIILAAAMVGQVSSGVVAICKLKSAAHVLRVSTAMYNIGSHIRCIPLKTGDDEFEYVGKAASIACSHTY